MEGGGGVSNRNDPQSRWLRPRNSNSQQSQTNSTALLTTLLMLKASSSPGSMVGDVMRTRRLHARLANVMRVDNRVRVTYAAATPAVRRVSCSPRPRGKKTLMRSSCAPLSLQYLPPPPMPY
jgi:hypothetical protein